MKLIIILSILLSAACLQKTQIELVPLQEKKYEENLIKQNANLFQDERKFVIEDSSIAVIKPSNLIFELRKKKNENPKLTAKELADFGNDFLSKYGYDYTFDWEPKGKENEANLLKEDNENYYPFQFKFTGLNGKKQKFQLMNNSFGHPCFSTIDIPITRVTESSMVVVSGNNQIELKRPKEFYLEEFALVDKSLKKVIRKWKTPIDATPVGISDDGKRIYFDSWEFDQDESNGYKESPINLAVEIAEDGKLKLVDKKEIKSEEGSDIDHDKKFPEIIYRKFKVGAKEFIVKYSAPCT